MLICCINEKRCVLLSSKFDKKIFFHGRAKKQESEDKAGIAETGL